MPLKRGTFLFYGVGEPPELYLPQPAKQHTHKVTERANFLSLFLCQVTGDSTHGSELPFVFGIPLLSSAHEDDPVWPHMGHAFDQEDAKVAREVVKYWTNFAKTG